MKDESAGSGAVTQLSILWLLLGAWLGAWILFAVGVAPTAFQVLPSEMAAEMVSPLLRGLHLYGVAAGLAVAALAKTLGRSPVLVILPLVLAALCIFSEFWITASIGMVRPQAFGPDSTSEAAARFSALHTASRAVYFAVAAGLVTLTILHSRADVRGLYSTKR